MKLLIEDTLSFTKYAIIDNKELIYIDIIEKNDDARLDGYAGAGVAARRLVPYPDTGQLHCMGTPSRHTSRHAGRADRLEQCRENSGDFALWLCLLTAQPGIADRL